MKQTKVTYESGPPGALVLGQCEERAGRLLEALEAYESAREYDPRHGPFASNAPLTKRQTALLPTLATLVERAIAVAPRIPQIRFRVHGAAPTVLWIDDDPVAIGTLSGSYGVNPGTHHVVASGPDGMFEETFSVVEHDSHVTEVTLGEPPPGWPRWVAHDDLECRLDKMLTYPQARDTNDCEAEKAAALRTSTSAEALALAGCYERAKLFPLACSALIEAQLRHPVKAVQTMQHRYSLSYLPTPRPSKESLQMSLALLENRSRTCPRGW